MYHAAVILCISLVVRPQYGVREYQIRCPYGGSDDNDHHHLLEEQERAEQESPSKALRSDRQP